MMEPRADDDERAASLRAVALAHGVFYAVTGIWPVLHMDSFEAVTGKKRDTWLVKTAGLLIASIGVVLTLAGLRRQTSPEIPLLGVTSAVSLAGIDLVYVRRRVIGPIYLADAAGELGLAAAWLAAWRRSRG